MYFPGEALNEKDFLLRNAEPAGKRHRRGGRAAVGRSRRGGVQLDRGSRLRLMRLDPLDRADRVGVAQRGDDRVQMRQIVHFDIDVEGVEAAVAVDQLQIDDVGVLRPQDARHGAERARNVAQDHRDARRAAVRAFAPGQVEPVGVDPAGQRVAADDMDLDLLVLAAQADDAVAGDRVAAGGEVISDAGGQPLDRDRGALAERLGRGDVAAGRARHQRLHQRLVADPLAGDRRHQRILVLDLELLERALERILVEHRRQPLDDLVVDLAAELDGLLALLVADEAAHSGARLAGGDEAQPRRLRVLRLGGEDFDLVAILEDGAQRHHPAVDLGADGAVAKVGVDRISEIDRGRALGQLDQLALGGEGEDAVLVHRHPGMLEQLLGALGMVEDLDQIVDPRDVQVGRRLAFLIGPVGGQPALGLLVHPRGRGSGFRCASWRRG